MHDYYRYGGKYECYSDYRSEVEMLAEEKDSENYCCNRLESSKYGGSGWANASDGFHSSYI